jgi:putative DNA primase/helicase
VEYLVETVGTDCANKGTNDERINQLRQAELTEAFVMYVCVVDSHYFLIDSSGRVHVFNGKYYDIVEPTFMESVIIDTLGKIGVGLVYKYGSAKTISDKCLLELRSRKECEFIPNRRYVAFNNGILDLETGKMKEFSDKYITDITLGIDYDPEATLPLWDKFIRQTFPVDGFLHTFQEFVGALLTDRKLYKIEYMCFIIGPGGNGKSVTLDAIANLFGDELISNYSPQQLFDSQNAMTNMADLDGKLANFSDDIKKKSFAGGDFKTFVSGGKFQARRLYQNPFKVTAPYMICCANEMPPTMDDTEGHHRRILPIKSTDHIYTREERDTQLTYKLSTDKAKQAIFNWIYDGYKRVVANRGELDISECVSLFRDEIKSNSNTVRRWLYECNLTQVQEPRRYNENRWRNLNDLFDQYSKFCKDNGDSDFYIRTKLEFRNTLERIGFIVKRRGNDGYMICVEEGVPLKLGEDDDIQFSGNDTGNEDLPF